MPRPRVRHGRLLILLVLLAIALFDARFDRRRKSLTILWKPTSKLRIDEGVRAIGRGVSGLWGATPEDAGVRVAPLRTDPHASGDAKIDPTAPGAPTRRRSAAPDTGALDRHSEQDRRRLDQAVSGN